MQKECISCESKTPQSLFYSSTTRKLVRIQNEIFHPNFVAHGVR